MAVDNIMVALISSVIGGFLVAIVNHLFTRKKTEAETEKMRAEAEKLRAEAEKIKSEISKASSETKVAVEQAVEKITGGYLVESETSRKLTQEVVQGIHKYLRECKSERGERKEFVGAVLPILKNDVAMSEFMIDSLIAKGYLTETSPGRYEISRTARQKFILGGAK